MDLAPRCRLSDPAHRHTLCRRDNPPQSDCFTCGPQGEAFGDRYWHYYCEVCKLAFHKDCHLIAQGMRHPYHLHHPLDFTIRFSETETISVNTNLCEIQHLLWNVLLYDNVVFVSNNACDWCGKELGEFFFRCPICGFSLDRSCILKDYPLTIENPKSHQHPLTFFPRPLLVACSACGLCVREDPGYACLQCNYFVHKSCIDLPRVIKLTRHPHRLSLTSCLPPATKRSCGVCHRNIDVSHGLYSCKEGCSYAVHSRCATHKDVWDGKDLDGVPEEPIEDTTPFEEVGYNLINHCSHKHHLRFKEDGLDHDENKQCQACCRPVGCNGFYSCISHCDFFLHASCANLPKKKDHPVHKHSLILKPRNDNTTSCTTCRRVFNGFSYECSSSSSCDIDEFKIDVGCSSLCEPFEHSVHPHPLFIYSHQDVLSICGVCAKECHYSTLQCNNCEFSLCFTCATIPSVVHYKHDEHPLTLCVGEEDPSGPYWCEKCEREIDQRKWFYMCNECCTTLHVECNFGPFKHLKSGRKFGNIEYELIIASNNSNNRPICDECGARCRYAGFFQGKDVCICSLKCISKLPSYRTFFKKFKSRMLLK